MIYHTPILFHKIFKNIIWTGKDDSIYLTFDDGPNEKATNEILEVLNEFKILATFFSIGKKISENAKLLKQVEFQEHKIGNHGFNHSRLLAFSNSKVTNSIIKTEKEFELNQIKFEKLYRPPFGFFLPHNISAIQKLNYKIVMWNILAGEFLNWSDDKILIHIEKYLKPGAIIVFHDNETTANRIKITLRKTILRIKDLGYSFNAI